MRGTPNLIAPGRTTDPLAGASAVVAAVTPAAATVARTMARFTAVPLHDNGGIRLRRRTRLSCSRPPPSKCACQRDHPVAHGHTLPGAAGGGGSFGHA